MTLTDAGPLIALVDIRQSDAHLRCQRALTRLRKPLLTTWPCLTEAMYFVGSAGGWTMQRSLWNYVEDGALRLYTLTKDDISRMRVLMEQFRDTPMDLADASLVATAEALDLKRIFTLDSDFNIYRLYGRTAFEIVP